MRFSKYFQDTQTPEWKKAYIDYRGLQTELEIIRAKVLPRADTLRSLGDTDVDYTHHSVPNHQKKYDDFNGAYFYQENKPFSGITSSWVSETDPTTNGTTDLSGHGPAPLTRQLTSKQKRLSINLTLAGLPPRATGTALNMSSKQTPTLPKTPRSPVFPFFKDLGSPVRSPLYTILSNLPTIHAKFFDMLDAELAKVETFYHTREKEMHERAKLLREQLEELSVHRQMLYESSARSKAQRACFSVPPALSSLTQWFSDLNTKPAAPHRGNGILASESERDGRCGFVDTFNLGTQAPEHIRLSSNNSGSWRNDEVAKGTANTASSPKSLYGSTRFPPRHSNGLSSLSFCRTQHALDPHGYDHAKTRLREAVVEHYRGLEVLNNYRILNLTSFRKVLKKYGKITNISVLDAYMKEKVEPSAFASGAMVTTILKETEYLFAMRFERGNRKKAISHLRVGPFSKTYHFSTFCSGSWLGLALPAIAGGSYLSFQEHIRRSLPWDTLLYIYSILVLPVLLALLIGINILVWERKRINYTFILGLNPRSRLNHREYFELPSFLFCTLAYAFWFSLAQIGSPTLWPLIWLALALVVMFNPFRRFMWGRARWWTIKKMVKLGASGLWSVEFTDAWLGDQLCCLVYSVSGLYFVGCFYTRFPNIAFPKLLPSAYGLQAHEAWSTCGIAQNFEWYFLLGVSPFMVRFVQSLRLYWDSKLSTHLINAGKYGMGVISQLCYCYWRYKEAPHTGRSYILWCSAATVHSIYGCAWDFLMDWSMFKPHARYPLLRPELIYKSHIPCYYFALVSNLCIRFIWLTYIYTDEAHLTQSTFIAALLEVLRRVQWNFYRLENNHLANMNQYHVTREVPLPYSFDVPFNEKAHGTSSWLKRQMTRLKRRGKATQEASISAHCV